MSSSLSNLLRIYLKGFIIVNVLIVIVIFIIKKIIIKKFKNTYSFCNNDTTESSSSERINKFVLSLRKGVYPYEYME